jgi:hypothetical protein
VKSNPGAKPFSLGNIVPQLFRRKVSTGSDDPVTGRIAARPNPLPADLDSPSTLKWDCNAERSEFCLSRDGGTEKRVSGRAHGSFNVERIHAGTDYLFRLYSLTPTRRLLDEVLVTREIAGRIGANPNPVPIECGGKTTLTWEITPFAGAEITVVKGNLSEKILCQAESGFLEVDWLRPGIDYSFRLYNQRGPRRLLDQVTVRLSDIPSPALSDRFMNAGDGLVQLIANILPNYIQNENFPKWFRVWEKSGFHVTPVHFYEPIPDSQSLDEKLWDRPSELVGVDMNDATQLSLLRDAFPLFRDEYDRIPPHPSDQTESFYLKNNRFEGLDPILAYCMVRHFKPRQIIEVGGGFSTLLLAQAAEKNGSTLLHCIEPYPAEFLTKPLPGLTSVLIKKVEEVDLSFFSRLEADDFLFIDTSHVVKIGGDVNFLVLEVLPRLHPGVIVHFHDIFLPFEYPRDWVVDQHRFWTEQYLLRAFLLFNSAFEVLVTTRYLNAYYRHELKAIFPSAEPWLGGSLWMRRKHDTEKRRAEGSPAIGRDSPAFSKPDAAED